MPDEILGVQHELLCARKLGTGGDGAAQNAEFEAANIARTVNGEFLLLLWQLSAGNKLTDNLP